MKKIELLAPAGSIESFKAAVHAGADAVYVGGTRFGARAYADNFTEESLKWAIDYAHLHGTALYMTINTLFKDRELETELYDYLRPYYEHGLDAVIVQDPGVVQALNEWFPDLPVHISTQMTITGREGFSFLKQFPNVTRIVTSRELSLEEIQWIRKNSDLEIESFIHGALCYCYSGQCLFSSVIGGRSGNRGRCAQPCRLPYDVVSKEQCISGAQEKYILSPKDLSTLEILPQILSSGIDSLKIEGRMKRPEYTAGVVSIYRKYIDLWQKSGGKDLKISKADVQQLEELFRKRGYSTGYYKQHNGRSMMSLSAPVNETTENERSAMLEALYEKYVASDKKINIKGILRVSTKNPMNLVVQWNEIIVELQGAVANIPKNRAMTLADFEKQMKKTGNTPFVFEKLEIILEDEVFVPNSMLNELRRNALEQLFEEITKKYRRQSKNVKSQTKAEDMAGRMEEASEFFSVSVETKEQLRAVLESELPKNIYIDSSCMTMEELKDFCNTAKGREALSRFDIYYILPAVFRKKTAERYTAEISALQEIPWSGFVVKNAESYQWLLENKIDKQVITDANLYTFNQRAQRFWEGQQQILYSSLPLELNYRELKSLDCRRKELLVYGRLPMMITAGCVYKSLKHCLKAEKKTLQSDGFYQLKDRKNMKFPVKPVCRECYNVIYNSQPLSLLNLQKETAALAPGSLRISFTVEDYGQTKDVLNRFSDNYIKKIPVKDFQDFTRGHFKRGVE